MTSRQWRAYLVGQLNRAGLSNGVAKVQVDRALAAHRAEVLWEAADFLRDAHFTNGRSVQEIGTALRMAALAEPSTGSPDTG